MEEVTLQAIKRAMPGHGRARVNISLLTDIGIEDTGEVEVITSGGSTLTLTVFADALVEKNQIRISEDDIVKLGISEGDLITVKRKIPMTEQVKTVAGDLAEKVSKGIHTAGEVLSEKTGEIKEGTAQAAQDLSEKAREVSATIAEQVAPLGSRIEEAGREAAARIQDLVPTGRFNAAVEAGLKRLSPEDAAELKKHLLSAEGEQHAITVSAETAAGRTIQNLTIPPDVNIIAVHRPDNTLMRAEPSSIITIGDLVYLTGSERGIEYMAGILEG